MVLGSIGLSPLTAGKEGTLGPTAARTRVPPTAQPSLERVPPKPAARGEPSPAQPWALTS